MESGIEHRHLGSALHDLFAGFNTHQVGRIVQRSQGEAVTDRLFRGVVHNNRGRERAAAVQHPMADSTDFISALDHAELRILQDLEHQLCSGFMVRDLLCDLSLFVTGAVLQLAALNADTFDQALGQLLLAVHVDQLILQGRRTCVHNQNFHTCFQLL